MKPTSKQLRVLLLRDLPEDGRVSMERFADQLETAFAASNEVRLTHMDISARLARRRGFIGRQVTRLVRYPLAAAQQPADLYHIVDQGYAHLAAFLPPERTIVTCHDLMLLRAEEGVAGFRGRRTSVLRYRWSTSYLRRVARVVCVSDSTRADVHRLRGVSEDRTVVIHPAVSDNFRPLSESERGALRKGIPGRRRHAILHVSTGHDYKNVPQTLRVISAMATAGFDISLIRIGRPLNKDERELARTLRIADRVIELGHVTDERLLEIYNAVDLLLFPSHYEGFGWPPLEAMACGTPVVVSTAPSLSEIVDGAGLTAAPTDTEGFAGAAKALLESEDLRKLLCERGLIRAASFNLARAREAYQTVYAEVSEHASRISGEVSPTCVG
jgi:glycosyltransferase involved in cell wall biosynthesis